MLLSLGWTVRHTGQLTDEEFIEEDNDREHVLRQVKYRVAYVQDACRRGKKTCLKDKRPKNIKAHKDPISKEFVDDDSTRKMMVTNENDVILSCTTPALSASPASSMRRQFSSGAGYTYSKYHTGVTVRLSPTVEI